MNNCNFTPIACSPCTQPAAGWHHGGCIANDAIPACNPHAPWHWNECGCTRCSASACSCGHCHDSCTAGHWNNWHGCIGASSGYLIPRYVSIGRTFQRQMTQTLCPDGVPEYADSPLTLMGVTVCGQASWEQLSECRQQLLRVTVPVALQIRDCSGRCRTGHAEVMLTIPIFGCSQHDIWRGQLYVAPCIRLAAPVAENEDGCFDAPLEVNADVYLVRLTAAPTAGQSSC